MQIQFLGGADEIGASSALLHIGGKRILIDAGIRMNDRLERGKHPDFSQAGGADMIFLTHAHTDHSGALPVANRHFRNAPIFMTPGTFQLCTVLFKDAVKLMDVFAEEGETPVYDEKELARTFKNIRQADFFETIAVSDTIRACFLPAGHILGAACIYIESTSGNVLFTGDFSTIDQITVSKANVKAAPHVVVTEATYGGKLHIDRKELVHECILKAKEIIERGGKILIPAFAVGRSQEMILLLKDAMAQKIIPEAPIFVDGMVNAVNRVYDNNPDGLPKRLQKKLSNEQSLFYNGPVQAVTARSRGYVLNKEGPAVIISSSGMLVGGPSVFYAKEILKHEKNALFISGYQDEESPGRRVLELERGQVLKLDTASVEVAAEVFRFSFSAHADANGIISFVNALDPEHVVLVHGEGEERDHLKSALSDGDVLLPGMSDTVEFPETHTEFFLPDPASPYRGMSLKDYWRQCLSRGIKRVSIKDLEQHFPDEAVEIDRASGFSRHWRDTDYFVVMPESETARYAGRKALYDNLGDITGHIVIYGKQHANHVGYCQDRDPDILAYHLLSSKKGKSRTRIDAKEIIHAFDPEDFGKGFRGMEENQIVPEIKNLKKAADKKAKEYRKILMEQGCEMTMSQARHRIGVTGQSIIGEIALITALITISVRKNDVFIINQGLKRAATVPEEKEDNISLIQDRLRKTLKPYPVKKISYRDRVFTLQFDFPDGMDQARVIREARAVVPAGFDTLISKKVNQAAFNSLLYRVVGPDGKISVHKDRKAVIISAASADKDFKARFLETTGYVLEEKASAADQDVKPLPANINQQDIIESARNCIPAGRRSTVKIGLTAGRINLKADFPDALIRECPDLLVRIERLTRMRAVLREQPNTNALTELIQSKVALSKNPSIDLSEKTVTIEAVSVTPQLLTEIENETGFRIITA